MRRRLYRQALVEARNGFARWERCNPAERGQWALKELRSLARWAGARVPYYRELFRKDGFDPQADFSFADYRRLPPLERKTVRDRADDLIAEGFSRQTMIQNSTGGSTGVPVRFWLDERSRAWRDASSDWAFSQIGHRQGDRVGLIWGLNVDPHAQKTTWSRLSSWLANSQAYDCYRLSDPILDTIDERLSAYDPDYLRCYTSALRLLAQRLRQRGKRPNYPKFGIITGGEKLDLLQRQIIEDVFSVPLYETYGSRDCGLIAMQVTPADSRLHVTGANIVVEPYGECDPNAGSEIVVTDLHRFGMPFLRYRIGDRVRFPSDSEDLPPEFLEEVTGRSVDFISLPDGRVIHGIQFPRLFREFDVCEFQVVQETTGDVQVLLVPGRDLAGLELEKMEKLLKSNLDGVSLSISFVPSIERSQNGKLRPVVSHYQAGNSSLAS